MKNSSLYDSLPIQLISNIRETRCIQIGRFTGEKITIISLIILCLTTGAFHASAQDIVPSRIKAVTLFPDQALITREANVKVHKGLNEILIDIEAFEVDSDSVSAKVFGKGELYSVQFKEIFLQAAPQKNIQALEEKLQQLKASRVAMEDNRIMLQNQERFLLSVMDFSKIQLPQDIMTTFPKIQDLENTLTFLGTNFKKINEAKQVLNAKVDSIKQEIQTVEKQLASLTIYRKKEKKAVEILFNTAEDQHIKIEPSYLIPNASWNPVYKVDVAPNLNTVNLTMFSKILQKTGEDWNNITLTVSNAIPAKGARLPEIATWDLDIARPQPIADRSKRFLHSQEADAPVHALAMKEVEAEMEEVGFAGALKKEMPFSVEYKLNQKLRIESKDEVTLLPVFNKILTGEFSYLAVPKTSPFAFLICKTKIDMEILDGPMNVHFGSQFIGKTFLEEKRAGEAFDINIGVDRSVKIKREKVKDKIQETFFGSFERNTIVREMAFTVVAENLKHEPITVTILDCIPVSRTDKIKVENVNIQPKPSEKNYQGREGVLLWSFVLQPAEVKKINISFSIIYPKDEPVVGL
ncbi:MAG: mucoidy inhibitor MuiA family protein [Desulfobacterales bacterium]